MKALQSKFGSGPARDDFTDVFTINKSPSNLVSVEDQDQFSRVRALQTAFGDAVFRLDSPPVARYSFKFRMRANDVDSTSSIFTWSFPAPGGKARYIIALKGDGSFLLISGSGTDTISDIETFFDIEFIIGNVPGDPLQIIVDGVLFDFLVDSTTAFDGPLYKNVSEVALTISRGAGGITWDFSSFDANPRGNYYSRRMGNAVSRTKLEEALLTDQSFGTCTIENFERFARSSSTAASCGHTRPIHPAAAYSFNARIRLSEPDPTDFASLLCPGVGTPTKFYAVSMSPTLVVGATPGSTGTFIVDGEDWHDITLLIPDSDADSALVLVDGKMTAIKVTSQASGDNRATVAHTTIGTNAAMDLDRFTVASIADFNYQLFLIWSNFLMNNVIDDIGHDVPTDWFVEEIPVEDFASLTYPLGIMRMSVAGRNRISLGGLSSPNRDLFIVNGTVSLAIVVEDKQLEKMETLRAVLKSMVDEIALRLEESARSSIPSLVGISVTTTSDRTIDPRSQFRSTRLSFAVSHLLTRERV